MIENKKPDLPCFSCGKELPRHDPDVNSGYVVFGTTGNYGSTVWDEGIWRGAPDLIIHVCDECVKCKQDHSCVQVVHRGETIFTYEKMDDYLRRAHPHNYPETK